MILFILSLLVVGLVVGALGRLAVPGPNPMGIGATILVGLGGSLLGGIVGKVLLNRPAGWLLSILGAAFIVWILQRSHHRRVL